MKTLAALSIICAVVLLVPQHALAWGDEGHEVIALIADHYLEPAVKEKVYAMLAADTDDLTAHDIASEATWADKYRDSDRRTTHERYNQTRNWHFTDIEVDNPDINAACFGRPPLPAATVASLGPARDCAVDKITEFAAELSSQSTNAEERLVALKFLLHLVGDLHQPLHSADNHDAGGNKIHVTAAGFRAGNLHHYWDTEFVERLGRDPREVSQRLIAGISEGDAKSWAAGSADDWAEQAFALARDHVYGKLPTPLSPDHYRLDSSYCVDAEQVVASQLSKAGVRLAFILNRAIGREAISRESR